MAKPEHTDEQDNHKNRQCPFWMVKSLFKTFKNGITADFSDLIFIFFDVLF